MRGSWKNQREADLDTVESKEEEEKKLASPF